MDITNALIRLRDDLKEWVTNNIIEVKSNVDETNYVIENLESRIEELEKLM